MRPARFLRRRGGRAALPFAAAAARRRTRLVALLLGALLLAVSVVWLLRGPWTEEQPVRLGAGTTMVVVDLSGSISQNDYVTIRRTLRALARQPGAHAGLIFFSDSAVEVLPPQMPARMLAAVARFFQHPVSVPAWAAAARNLYGPNSSVLEQANPWMSAFDGGTAIYRGLDLARQVLESVHAARGRIVLLSDLADGGDPHTRTALLRIAAARLQLRVVGLDPATTAKQVYLQIFGPSVFAPPRLAAGRQPDRPGQPQLPQLWPFALAVIGLLGLLEWWRAPLRLRRAA